MAKLLFVSEFSHHVSVSEHVGDDEGGSYFSKAVGTSSIEWEEREAWGLKTGIGKGGSGDTELSSEKLSSLTSFSLAKSLSIESRSKSSLFSLSILWIEWDVIILHF